MEMNQEMLMRAALLEQNFKETQQQLEFLDNQILELSKFMESIVALEKGKKSEILAPLGKGVHAKVSLVEEKFLVEVGAGVAVKKTAKQLLETVESQLSNLKNAKIHLSNQAEIARANLIALLEEVEQSQTQ